MSIAAKKRSKHHKDNISKALKGYKQSEEHRKNSGEAHSIYFKFKSPTGKIIRGKNVRNFCRENNLDQGAMCKVLKRKIKQHKGWTIPD